MSDDLVRHVARSAHLTPEQAAAAVQAMLRYLATRLPSPVFGAVQTHLEPGGRPAGDAAAAPADDAA